MRLARREGRTHPREAMKLFESHTQYEWAVQVAVSKVDPWGDERADKRAAYNTAQVVASNRVERFTPDEFWNHVRAFENYLLLQEMMRIENDE